MADLFGVCAQNRALLRHREAAAAASTAASAVAGDGRREAGGRISSATDFNSRDHWTIKTSGRHVGTDPIAVNSKSLGGVTFVAKL